jgi:hypothetical protein
MNISNIKSESLTTQSHITFPTVSMCSYICFYWIRLQLERDRYYLASYLVPRPREGTHHFMCALYAEHSCIPPTRSGPASWFVWDGEFVSKALGQRFILWPIFVFRGPLGTENSSVLSIVGCCSYWQTNVWLSDIRANTVITLTVVLYVTLTIRRLLMSCLSKLLTAFCVWPRHISKWHAVHVKQMHSCCYLYMKWSACFSVKT